MLLIHHFGDGNGRPLQYSCLENPMDGGAWWAAVHGVAEGRTRQSDFTFTFIRHLGSKISNLYSSHGNLKPNEVDTIMSPIYG